MCVPQLEVRPGVIKLGGTQLDDVGTTTEVFGVASAALRRRDAGEMPVIAALRGNVRRNVFVAVQAQACLALAVATVVTVGALLFVLGVRIAELAGHEQRLGIHRATSYRP
jgi:hypothetical protein